MRVQTPVTLSEDLLRAIDERLAQYGDRSAFLEMAAWAFIAQMMSQERDARDREILDRHADELNREALDVLSYQMRPHGSYH
jgi:metal-responsive CopG/Arc/MetJ family transcriptional regulator